MKKRYSLLAILFVVVLAGMAGLAMPTEASAAAKLSGETGVPDTSWYDPDETVFNITTADQFAGLAELVNSGITGFGRKTVTLGADIDLSAYGAGHSDEGWTPIANGRMTFAGVFDGKGHSISGLYINNKLHEHVGLFSWVIRGTVRNLSVVDMDFNVGDGIAIRAGGIVSRLDDGVMENCYSSGTMKGVSESTGGLVGFLYGSVMTGCHSSINIQCEEGTDSVIGNNIGGVVGDVFECDLTDCYSTGDVSGKDTRDSVGGVAGGLMKGEVKNCYSTGDIESARSAGGVVGRVDNGNVIDCHSAGSVTGESFVGGVVGSIVGGNIEGCYSTGTIFGESYVGEIAGYISEGFAYDDESDGAAPADPGLPDEPKDIKTDYEPKEEPLPPSQPPTGNAAGEVVFMAAVLGVLAMAIAIFYFRKFRKRRVPEDGSIN